MISYSRQRKRQRKIIFFIFAFILAISVFFMLDDISINIDTKKPIVKTNYDAIYLGRDNVVNIDIYDNSAIKFYKISISDNKDAIDVQSKNVKGKKTLHLSIKLPKVELFFNKDNAFLNITAVDNSYWNFGFGNKTIKKIKIIFDNNEPRVDIISMSNGISRGGTALVVFNVSDENLDKDSIYIKTNFNKEYKPLAYIKNGFYASLMAWPVYENSFSAYIIANDKAGNTVKRIIPIYKKRRFYQSSTIKLKDKFLNTKIASLYSELSQNSHDTDNAMNSDVSPVEKFVYLNGTVRTQNENIIASYTSSISSDKKMIDSFNIYPFYPLKNAARVGSFGAFRKFTRDGKQVSTSYHLGLDLASVRRADIIASNDGKVVFVGNLGLYGNSIIIRHALGLYTLYSHISRFLVYKNDSVYAGKTIAKTGATGLALGDHLHFGVIVQGIEVRPQEWMDKTWIRNNITNVLSEARNIIIGKVK